MGRCKNRVWLFVTPWTVASQAPLSVHGDSPGKETVWVAMPSSRDRTWVSCIAGGLFTDWATGKPLSGRCSPGEPDSWLHRPISIIQLRTVWFAVDSPDTDVVLGESTTSTVQSRCRKDLKWGTSLTARLHLIVVFGKQRIVHPQSMKSGRPWRSGLKPLWVPLFMFFVSSLEPALANQG